MPYIVPTEHQRRALFGWLKQSSSLTAWRRLYSYNQAFVDAVRGAYEEEQRTSGMPQTIPTQWFARVLQSHDAFEAALQRLQNADRRCFDFLGARGHFNEGLRAVTWWEDMYGGSFDGRNGFGPDAGPHWPEILKTIHDCLAALSDIDAVLQERHTDVPAPIDTVNDIPDQRESSLIKWWLTQTNLPPVPVLETELLVRTGRNIPHYGIWEPVQVTRPLSIIDRFRSLPLPPPEGRPLDGCMNYLQGGSAAPTIDFPEDGQRREGRPTTWRLLWRDDRYGPNPIPEEESHYVFVQPVPGEVLFTYG
jgi:Immunity protein 72/Immunity protein 71